MRNIRSRALTTALSVCAGDVIIIHPSERTLSVAAGESILLKCQAVDGARITWYHQSTEIAPHATARRRVEEVVDSVTGMRTSVLTINDAAFSDSGRITCKNPSDIFDTDAVVVRVSSFEEAQGVEIVEPVDARIVIDASKSFTLKCVGDVDRDLIWTYNGQPLSAGARVLVTKAADIDERTMVSMLSRMSLRPGDSGTYACHDASDLRNFDDVEVMVRPADRGQARVEIVTPREGSTTLKVGDTLNVMCRAGLDTDVTWYVDGSPARPDQRRVYVHEAVDENENIKTSLLVVEGVTSADAGTYTCKNAASSTDVDDVTVYVLSKDGAALHPEAVPSKVMDVVMRVDAGVTLQCSFEATVSHVPEWSRDNQVLTSGSKYIINSDSTPTILKIRNTKRSDVGIYKCSFKDVVTNHVAGVVVFNISTAPCDRLEAPSHGSFENCPSDPQYGETCTFRCDDGYTLTSSVPLVCERDGGRTYWRGHTPSCKVLSDVEPEVPTSLSHVLLRVGSTLKLQCRQGAFWDRNGVRLRNGDKFTIGSDALIIKNTGASDIGIYDCTIHRNGRALVRGIKKFNVTTVACSRLVPPSHGSVRNCSDDQVFGETCNFRCNHGYRLVGSRSRTCELAHSQTQVYWTGDTPTCRGGSRSWKGQAREIRR
ncbi:hypothetical protein NP493_495g02006 [Ridgeia piscesae]|uniref:Uncharacterized protein n=1 Tax=Ridgeia piscesae TaxID=27915 RepID=A0AAD9KX82_RIDPI|nr:hypothetical protein NP493_495g02006 [Ridgeia piscesae]